MLLSTGAKHNGTHPQKVAPAALHRRRAKEGGIILSTLEMAINLLQEMPEQAVETVYAFMQSVLAQQGRRSEASAAFGIAHKYANPALIDCEKGAFERAMAEKHEAG